MVDNYLLDILKEYCHDYFDDDKLHTISSIEKCAQWRNHTLQPDEWDYVHKLSEEIRNSTYEAFRGVK